jgi:hypothetical protein
MTECNLKKCVEINCLVHVKCQILIIKGVKKNKKCGKLLYHDDLCKVHYTNELKRPYNPYIDHERDICCGCLV